MSAAKNLEQYTAGNPYLLSIEELEIIRRAERNARRRERYWGKKAREKLANSTPHKPIDKVRYLYFIGCGDAVKIGIAKNVENRMRELQPGAMDKLYIIAKFHDGAHLEVACHKRLSRLHVYGEWFHQGEEVDALIDELSRQFEKVQS